MSPVDLSRRSELEPLAVRIAEAATMTGISRSLAYELVRRGEWPVIRLSKRATRVPVEALREWVAEKAQEGRRPGSGV